jgi:hypothetical protein
MAITENQVLHAAIGYVALGWSVIPIQPRGKIPLVRWEEFQRRRADIDEVERWFKRWPAANVGVVTGAISGLVVLDIDQRHGGGESLERWEMRHGPLPLTIEATTGGGGRHAYFVHPGFTLRNRAGLVPGVDLRGDGGMVVVAPSIHASGRAYAWRAAHAPGEVPLAPMPPWLLRQARAEGTRAGHPASFWRTLVKEGVEQGRRNNTIASFAGHLLWHGVEPDVVAELLLCWNRVRCRPPLADDEVARVVASIARRHEVDH